MANNTFLQIPNDVDDPVILRRVLDSIVIAIDEIRGDRGDSKMASEADLQDAASNQVSTATNLGQLVRDLNALDNNFLRRDGKNVADAPISYDKTHTLAGLNFADVDTVTDMIGKITPTVTVVPQASPAPLAGSVDPALMSSKIDELIAILIATKVLI